MRLPTFSFRKLCQRIGLWREPRRLTTAELKREAEFRPTCEELESRHMLSGFSIASAASTGETGNLAFTVSLKHAHCHPVSVFYETADGSAKAGEDYTAASGKLTFAPGETSKQIEVALLNDTVAEGDETFAVNLFRGKRHKHHHRHHHHSHHHHKPKSSATGTIKDDDGPSASRPTVGWDPASVTVDEAAVTASLTVKLSGVDAQQAITVHYATTDDSALAGQDYTASSGDLSFALGERQKTITVPITNDTSAEGAERFKVALTSPTNATLGTASATVTIEDNDASSGGPSLSINDTSVSEAAGSAQFTVSLSSAADHAVTVAYATAEDTAKAGDDFTAVANGSLTFAAGETQKTLSIAVSNDTTDETDEQFHVSLSNANGATIGDASGVATIQDNDDPPTLGFDPANLIVGEGAGKAIFTAKLTGNNTAKTVTASVTTAEHTAKAGEDYTTTNVNLTFLPGERQKTVEVPILDDGVSDDAEHFHGTLVNVVNATLGVDSAEAVITDNDTAGSGGSGSGGTNDQGPTTIGFNPANLIVREGAVARLTIRLTGIAATQPVTASFTTTGHTATPDVDYTTTNVNLTFAPGEREKTVDVPILADSAADEAEHFHGVLFNVVNATLGENSVEVVIQDGGAAGNTVDAAAQV